MKPCLILAILLLLPNYLRAEVGDYPVARGFECVASYGGDIDYCLHEQFLVIGQGRALSVWDISNEAKLERLSRVILPVPILSVTTKWPAIYVGTEDNDLKVFDATNPRDLQRRKECDIKARSQNLHARALGDVLIVNNKTKHMSDLLFNIEDPFHPKIITHHTFMLGQRFLLGQFATDGRFFYYRGRDMDDGYIGVLRLDILNPERIDRMGSVEPGEISHFFLRDGSLFFGNPKSINTKFTRSICKYDPSRPCLVTDYEEMPEYLQMPDPPKAVQGILSRLTTPHFESFRRKGDLFFLLSDLDLWAVDMSHLNDPVRVGEYHIPDSVRLDKNEYQSDAEFSDFYIHRENGYVFASNGHILVLDLQNPSKMIQIGDLSTGGFGTADFSGDYMFISRGESLRTFDISDPKSPRLISTYKTKNTCSDVLTSGSLVMTVDHGLTVLEMKNPTSPQVLYKQRFPIPEGINEDYWGIDLERQGDTVYLSGGHANGHGLFTYDFSNGWSVEPVRHPADIPVDDNASVGKQSPPRSRKTESGGPFLCCSQSWSNTARMDSAITFYDISTSTAPRFVGEHWRIYPHKDLFISGDPIFSVDWNGLICIRKSGSR